MTPHPIPKVQAVGEIVAEHMDDILALFKPGKKITVLVRDPQTPDGSRDFIQTNDELDAIIAAVERRKDPAKTLTGQLTMPGLPVRLPAPPRMMTGLLNELPTLHTEWPLERRLLWLRAAAALFDVIYGTAGAVTITGTKLATEVERSES